MVGDSDRGVDWGRYDFNEAPCDISRGIKSEWFVESQEYRASQPTIN